MSSKNTMNISKDDLIREFEFENNRCMFYLDFMYKILQFTFTADIALLTIAFSEKILSGSDVASIFLELILPICTFVFGIMYAFNAYVLAVCGERAEMLHLKIYSCFTAGGEMSGDEKSLYDNLCRYVIADRKVSLISYGVPLGFYLVIPWASCYLGWRHFTPYDDLLLKISPVLCLIVYYILMAAIIIAIAKKHFSVNKIQNNRKHIELT